MKILDDKEINLDKNKFKEILFKDYIILYLSKSNKIFTNQNILNSLILYMIYSYQEIKIIKKMK